MAESAVGKIPVGQAGSHRFPGARIKEHLLLEIRRRPPNDRLPPEVELAERFGVNRLTVNKVMAELRREGYVQRIRGKGTFIVRPDRRVLTEVASRSRTRHGQIVIAYPDYFSFDIWSKVNGAEDLAHGKDVELVSFKMNKATAYESLAALVEERGRDVKGAVVLPPGLNIDARSVSLLNSLNIPVAVLAACDRAALGDNVVCVYRDYFKEGYLAVNHLICAGHEHLGYVANEPWNLGSRMQYQGIKAALYEHGFSLKDLARSPNGVQMWDSSTKAGHRFTSELLRAGKVTALIYRSMPGAIGGLLAISEAGLRVPDDISIVSQGDGSIVEEFLVPPLTSIVCDYHAWMSVAFEAILDRSRRHEKQIVIDVKLMERNSVRSISRPQGRNLDG
jgi:DNA-binding LacI/PurR family transcriptional regulator